MEGAARRRVRRRWNVPQQGGSSPPAIGIHRGRRGEKGAGIGMPRVGENRLGASGLNDPTQVHDRHPVGQVAHHPEIVGDE